MTVVATCDKSQGLPQLQLHIVFHASLISHPLYAAPAWSGFARILPTISKDIDQDQAPSNSFTILHFVDMQKDCETNFSDDKIKYIFAIYVLP